jgi:hypothetical protein
VTRVAVFDCFSGIAGDMTIAALLDAGAPLETVLAGLRRLTIPGFRLAPREVTRGGMRALHLSVDMDAEHTYQPDQLRAKVMAAQLPLRVTDRAMAAIAALEEGERRAHGGQDVHLHEAGGVDALIDITGAMLALEALGVDDAWCPVVTVGSGTVTRSAHGVLPAAPGPAAAHILQAAGFALRFVETSHELVTPTGAAILAAVAKPGPVVITPTAHGAGAGTMDPAGRPNALRIFIGELAGVPGTRPLVLLEANIDDMTSVQLGHARDRLMEEGALDAWTEAIGMKKGRPAQKLCALAQEADESRFVRLFLAETTTLGVRIAPYRRYEAARMLKTVDTSLGPVRMKVSEFGDRVRHSLEFEDVKAIAARLGRPLIEIQRELEREVGRG